MLVKNSFLNFNMISDYFNYYELTWGEKIEKYFDLLYLTENNI